MAIEVATGYVSIIPSLKGFNRDLLAQIDPSLETAGQQAGERVSKGFRDNLARNLGDTGKKMSQWVTLPLAGAGAASLMVAADFESSMSQVAQAIGKPGEKIDGLTELAKRLGAETQFSAGQAAQAMVELAKGGMSEAQIEAGALESAMALAAAGQMDLKDAANLTVGTMGAFNLTAGDSAAIADALAGAANSSSADVSQLAEALQQAGAQANQMGFDLPEVTGALAALADAGIKGSDAGTSLKTMMANLVPQTKAAALMMDQYGISFTNADGSIKSMDQVAEILHKRLGGLTDAQRTQALQTMFGSDAYRAAAVLMDNGAKGLQKYEDASRKVGSASEAAAANMGPTQRAMEEMKGAAETAGIAIGEALAPVVSDLAGLLKGVFGWFTGLPKGMQSTVAGLGVLAAATGPVLVVTSKLITAFGIVKGALLSERAALIANRVAWLARQAVTGAQVLWAAITAIGQMTAAWLINTTAVVANKIALVASNIAMYAVRGAVVAWTVAQWALNAALNMNPIGLVVIAVAALVAAIVLLWNRSETFRTIVIAGWNAIKAAAEVVWNGIKAVITAVWDAIAWYVRTYIAVVRTVIETVWNAIKTATQLAWDAIKTFIITPIQTAWTTLQTVIVAVRDWLSGAWQTIRDRAAAAWAAVKDAVLTPLRAARDTVQNVVAAVRDWLADAWQTIRDRASSAWSGVKAAITNPLAGLWDTFKDLLGLGDNGGIVEGKGALGRLVGVFSAAVNLIKGVFGGIKDAIVAPIADAFRWVNDNVIGKLNSSVLSKFGDNVRIPNLPIPPGYSTGGLARGPRSGHLAVLHGDEFVVNERESRANLGLLTAINAGRGAGPSLQATQPNWQPPSIGDAIAKLFKAGARAAINTLALPALDFAQQRFGGTFGGDLAISSLRTVIDSVGDWANELNLAPTELMEALASRMEAIIGDGGYFHKCLQTINLTMQSLGRSFGFTVNSFAQAGTAWQAGQGVLGAGMMNPGVNGPRGALAFWDPGVGNYAGHIAVLDGKGNFVNNFGGDQIERLPLASAMSGYRGWAYPWAFIAGGRKYDQGGYLQPGWTATYNGTGKPEAILTAEQWDALTSGPQIVNHWQVDASTVPTEEATMTAWRHWEALQAA